MEQIVELLVEKGSPALQEAMAQYVVVSYIWMCIAMVFIVVGLLIAVAAWRSGDCEKVGVTLFGAAWMFVCLMLLLVDVWRLIKVHYWPNAWMLEHIGEVIGK